MMTGFAGQRAGPAALRYDRREVAGLAWIPTSRLLHAVGAVVGVAGLLIVTGMGALGPAQPERNLAFLLAWTYFWAGMVVLTGLVGPLWDAINPFRALDTLATRALGPRAGVVEGEPEEDRLRHRGVWPAVGLFFVFGLFDVTGISTSRPWAMALLTLGYTAFTLAGMRRFGARAWLAHVEFFSVLFSILRRFAPIDVRGG